MSTPKTSKKNEKSRTKIVVFAIITLLVAGLAVFATQAFSGTPTAEADDPEWKLSEDEWKERLSEEEFYVLREQGTDRPFQGDLWDNKEEGIYKCAGCGQELFSSEHKYKSGTGWPSFYQPVDESKIGTQEDHKLFTVRTEVHCKRCGGHMGHVFDDGPEPTGLRYCINTAALDFEATEESDGDSTGPDEKPGEEAK